MNTNEIKVFTLRMHNNLLEKVKANAEKNKRSAAKEIEYILEKYFLHIDN